MKRLFTLVAAITLVSAGGLRADDAPKAGAGGGASGGLVVIASEGGQPAALLNPVYGEGKAAAQWYIESVDKVVSLTDAQKKAITEIIEARDKAMRDFQAKSAEQLKAASTAMIEAYKSKDKDAIAKAQKAYQDLYVLMHEAMKKSQKELDDVLTAEQKDKLLESRMTTWVKALTAPVQLSDEQMKKAKAAYSELTKASPQQGMGGKLPEVVQDILTPEQKQTIYKHRAMSYVKSMFAPAKLIPEQLKQAEAAVDAMGKEQGFKFDWKMYQKLSEKVRSLLTDEQKEALKRPRNVPIRPGAAPGGAVQNPAPQPPAEKKEPAAKVLQLPGGGVQVIISEGAEGKKAQPGKPAWQNPAPKTPRGIDVKQLPGGGIRVIIREAGEREQGEARRLGQQAPGQPCPSAPELMKAAKARMGKRVKRQHELAEKAWQIYQKMEALGEDKKADAHERWEQLERVEGELRGTFGPAAASGGWTQLRPGAVMPGAPVPGGAIGVYNPRPGNREAMERRLKELSEKAEQLTKEGKTEEAKRAKHEAHELHEALEQLPRQPRVHTLLPGQPLKVRSNPEVQELRNQVEQLRRRVEEPKAMVKAVAERK